MTDEAERTQLAAASAELARSLGAAAGDETKEREACAKAVDRFMQIKRAAGAAADIEPAELMCAEFFAEGDGDIDAALDQVTDASDDDIERWWEMLADAAEY